MHKWKEWNVVHKTASNVFCGSAIFQEQYRLDCYRYDLIFRKLRLEFICLIGVT